MVQFGDLNRSLSAADELSEVRSQSKQVLKEKQSLWTLTVRAVLKRPLEELQLFWLHFSPLTVAAFINIKFLASRSGLSCTVMPLMKRNFFSFMLTSQTSCLCFEDRPA